LIFAKKDVILFFMLDIIKYPNKILRQRTKRVPNSEILEAEFQKFIEEMKETMLKGDGIGLAANQVNNNKRILVVNLKEGPQAFINPFIYWKSYFKKDLAEEGCLSFPEIFGLVKRPISIWLVFTDQSGKMHNLKAKGILARILLHEVDHLNGILYIDRILKYTKGQNKINKLISEAKSDEI
jgi:peptide deformylase